MAEHSKIEWTDHTFNPWVGCTPVSLACDFCYAETWAKRSGHPELWQGERRRTSAANWQQPIKWNKEAAASGIRRKVFCASLADVFDNQVPLEWRLDLWKLIEQTPNLDWLLLTKRPQNMRKMLPYAWGPNVWLGTTAENQEEADRRIPILLQTPAAVRFVSLEPLLGEIDLTRWMPRRRYYNAVCEKCGHTGSTEDFGLVRYEDDADVACPKCMEIILAEEIGRLNWAIVGGESGPNARPMHPDWARSLRDQCQGAGVPFFMKQMTKKAPIPADLFIREMPNPRPAAA